MSNRLQQQQQAIMQQAIMQQAMFQQQQQQLYQSSVLAAVSQMEPVPSGNLPPGFDPSSCRNVYVGNIHPNVTEALLAQVFQSTGPLEGYKLIRKEKSSYGFIEYHDRRSAALAIMALHGRQLYGQAIKVNWAYASGQREDTSGHFHIFVGDLSSDVTDAALHFAFSNYSSCSDARVMWDNKTGRSRGFGFVSFRNQQDAQDAINEMTGKWLGARQIRCNWATKSLGEERQSSENHGSVVLANGGCANLDGGQENLSEEAPENNPAYTTVYVGNLAHEVTQAELHRQFHMLGAGVIEEVRIQREKGFGFVRYHTHEEAALAIQMATGRIIFGKSMKCSWGNKPTPAGLPSIPLPAPGSAVKLLPTASAHQGYLSPEMLAHQHQLQLMLLNQSAAGAMAGQQGVATQASVGLISGSSQAMHDGYISQSTAQQLMYYS